MNDERNGMSGSASTAFGESRRRAIIARLRTIPCIAALGLKLIDLAEGYCKIKARHDRRFDGVYPIFHGGMLANVADCAAWMAIATRTGRKNTW